MSAMPKRKRAVGQWPKFLKRLRSRLGLTQTQAGKAVGVSQNLWSAWERGTRTPDASRQLLIAMLDSGQLTA